MSHERITHFRLASPTDWDVVQERAESLATALAELEGCERLSLVRLDDARAMLLATFTDGAALDELGREVIDPWIEERMAPLLGEPPTTTAGEVIVRLTRVSDGDWATHDALDDTDRIDDFVQRVVECAAVWGLYGDSWARAPRDDGGEALPFWPRMELAARCITDEWAELSPRRIELDEFIEQWLGGMDEDGIVAIISPTPRAPGVSVSPGELAAALRHAAEEA